MLGKQSHNNNLQNIPHSGLHNSNSLLEQTLEEEMVANLAHSMVTPMELLMAPQTEPQMALSLAPQTEPQMALS